MKINNRLQRTLKYTLLLFLGGTIFTSCYEDTSCGETLESDLLFSLYKMQEQNGSKTFRRDNDSLKIYEYGVYTDTVYPRKTDTLSMIPLHATDTISEYLFVLKNGAEDRIRITHSLPTPVFLDMNCGFTAQYNLKQVAFTTNFIDSIYIVNPEVTNDVFETNILIFY